MTNKSNHPPEHSRPNRFAALSALAAVLIWQAFTPTPAAAQLSEEPIVFDVHLVQAGVAARDAIAAARAPEGPETRSAQQEADVHDTAVIRVHVLDPSADARALVSAERAKQTLSLEASYTLTARAGHDAVLNLGGRQPVPTAAGGSESAAATPGPEIIHELGIVLTVTPFIMPDGRLLVRVTPVMRTVDFETSDERDGHFVPALVTRQLSAEIALAGGQSFVVTGLLNDAVVGKIDQMPQLKARREIRGLVTARAALPGTDLVLVVTPRAVPAPPAD